MQCSPSSMGPVGWVRDDMLMKEQHDSVDLQPRADGTPRAVTCQCVFDSWVSAATQRMMKYATKNGGQLKTMADMDVSHASIAHS